MLPPSRPGGRRGSKQMQEAALTDRRSSNPGELGPLLPAAPLELRSTPTPTGRRGSKGELGTERRGSKGELPMPGERRGSKGELDTQRRSSKGEMDRAASPLQGSFSVPGSSRGASPTPGSFPKRVAKRMSKFVAPNSPGGSTRSPPKSLLSERRSDEEDRRGNGTPRSERRMRDWRRKIAAGQYFGTEQLLLPEANSRWNATYRVGSQMCTLLALPKIAFVEFFDNNVSLCAEIHIKILRNKCTLQAVLGHHLAQNFFMQWLKKRQGARYLDFMAAVERYCRVDHDRLPNAARALCNDMLEDYIFPGAPQQIVLPVEVRQPILNRHEHGGVVPVSLWQIARQSVISHLESAFLNEFTKDAPFNMLLVALGSYPTIMDDVEASPYFFNSVRRLKFRRENLFDHRPRSASLATLGHEGMGDDERHLMGAASSRMEWAGASSSPRHSASEVDPRGTMRRGSGQGGTCQTT
jgi:hypothetical protein